MHSNMHVEIVSTTHKQREHHTFVPRVCSCRSASHDTVWVLVEASSFQPNLPFLRQEAVAHNHACGHPFLNQAKESNLSGQVK